MKKRKVLKLIIGVILGYLVLIYLLALLPSEKLVGRGCLPEHLKERLHDDYDIPGTKWIPFAATSFCFVEPPIQILGNQDFNYPGLNNKMGPKPIPLPGQWQFTIVQEKKGWPLYLPYFAFTTKGGIHFRIGARWDDIDNYYVFPSFGIKL